MNADGRLHDAVTAWRESLVMLSGRNRLLNYRPTRSSTLEFIRASTDEVLSLVAQDRGIPVMGVIPAAPPAVGPTETLAVEDDLELRALEVLEDFDISAFSDHLFVNKTQREVDRALKTLASTASREYLDKGLSVLYLALGALHWTEANGDARVSPLVFLPVELRSDGPRQPARVYSSDEDLVLNPALDIRVREYGVTMPDQSTIETLIAEGGMAAVESTIRSLPLPEGWLVEPMCVLSAFMFAKEAMFRDLEVHAAEVMASPVVQALASASDPARGRMLFAPDSSDDIDRTDPPEAAALILDADSSQRVAVAAAAAGKSFVLDGPPGTGKSQTIANIIANLVSGGKKVLFVSEKAVALDVVRDRLAGRGLGPLLFELHSHKATRAEVAKSLGAALTEKPSIVERNSSTRLARAQKLRLELSGYAAAMNEVRHPIGWTLHDVIGLLSALPDITRLPAVRMTVGDLSGERWNELEDLIRAVAASWDLLVQGDKHPWAGVREVDGVRFDVSEATRTLEDLREALHAVAPRRAEVGLDGTDRWREIADLAMHMKAAQPGWIAKVWLWEAPDEVLSRATAILPRISAALDEDEHLTDIVGPQWRTLRDAPPLPSVSSVPTTTFGALDELSSAEVALLVERADRWVSTIESLTVTSTAIGRDAGLPAPRYLGDLGATARAVRALDEIDGVRAIWVTAAGLDALESALDALERSQLAEAQAGERALQTFDPTVLGIDFPHIWERWQSLPVWKRALFGPAGEDRRTVGPHSRLKPKAAIAALDSVVDWQRAREDLDEKSRDVAAILGLVPDDENSWRRARQVVTQCRDIREAFPHIDADLLGATRTNEYAWRAAVREASVVESQLAECAVLAGGAAYADASRQIETAILEVRSTVRLATDALDSARAFADGGRRSLAQARGIQQQVSAAALERDKIDEEVAQLSVSLPGNDAALSREWVQQTSQRLTWTHEFRRRTTQEHRANCLDAFAEIAWSDSLLPAGKQWDAASARLRARFDGDRYADSLRDESEARELLARLTAHVEDAPALLRAAELALRLHEYGLGAVLEALLTRAENKEAVEGLLRAATLSAWADAVMRGDTRFAGNFTFLNRDEIAEQFRDLDREMVDHAAATVLANAVGRRPSASSGQTALILGEASKKRRHIPVRDLIARATDVIQAIHPCFMMSPLAVSQYLPPDIKFDVVIFDEASQVPPGDAINCMYRAKAVIAAGDQKQLPPTAFFASAQGVDDEDGEEDLAQDYESLLDLMKGSGAFTSISLLWHYRSRHEHLIAYSNNAFYEDRLITFPGALADVPDAGVKFHRVDGIYRRSQGQDNPREAKYVADRVIHHLDSRPGKSIGVVAMSAAQRDAIANALVLRRAERPDLESHFGESRLDGIFVKSLEEVQGDERDVIIMSIGYGPDSTGTVYRNFGPINLKGGERRLNVAITRAKELTEVVASMSAGDIGDIASVGGRHLRRYLDYAERGAAALELEVGPSGLGTDSPFEDAVINSIRSWGYEVQPQVGVSGFRIDIGVKHPRRPGVFMLGVECDGAMYHSAKSARDRDRLRHDILVGLGWNMHHIWGTDWYRHREREEERLRTLLEALESDAGVGRVGKPAAARVEMTVELESQTFDSQVRPAWVVDYVPVKPRRLRSLDWTDRTNARHLVPFVEEVAEAEGPVHLDTLKARLREHSVLERVNKHAERTLREAIAEAAVTFDGKFLRTPRSRVTEVRDAGGRALDHISDEEFTLAVMNALSSQVGPSRADLALAVARAFGWRRTGGDISARVNEVVSAAIADGSVEDGTALSLKRA